MRWMLVPSLRRIVVGLVLLSSSVAAMACGNSPAAPAAPSASMVTLMQINGLATYSRLGLKAQYQAIATFGDQSTKDVSTVAAWASSDPTLLSIDAHGLATEVAQGGTISVTATYSGVTGTLSVNMGLENEDCTNYPPALAITPTGSAFDLFAGLESLATLDTQTDAANALALAQRYTTLCFIGRNNNRPNRQAYIAEYWKNLTGATTTIAPEDCTGFNTAGLQAVSAGANGWSVTDGSSQVLLLDTQADATLAVNVLKQYSAQCFIGRGNTSRPAGLHRAVLEVGGPALATAFATTRCDRSRRRSRR